MASMSWKGKLVVLDNFRKIFGNYSVDIQDIVRSAICDGVDISKYVDVCKDNPFRLDQIRLGIKEGLPDAIFSLNGDAIYKVRSLRKSNGFSEIVKQLGSGSLSEEHVNHLLQWVSEGKNIHGIELVTVPKNLLSIYDVGLSYGVDMSEFNGFTGSAEYLKCLVVMRKNNRPVEKYLKIIWNISVLNVVSRNSNNYLGWYEDFYDCLTIDMDYEVVDGLTTLYMYMSKMTARNQLSIPEVREIAKNKNYLKVVINAAKAGMDLKKFVGLDEFSADSLYMSLKENAKRSISGSIRGKRNQLE